MTGRLIYPSRRISLVRTTDSVYHFYAILPANIRLGIHFIRITVAALCENQLIARMLFGYHFDRVDDRRVFID